MVSKIAIGWGMCVAAFAGLPAVTASEWSRMLERAEPTAWWRFDGEEEGWKRIGNVTQTTGPMAPFFPDFGETNPAVHVDGRSGAHLRVTDEALASELAMRHGDAITVEAWLTCDGIDRGQNQYVIGKGRTEASGPKKDAQNWALRLRGERGEARLSFLFRSEPGEGDGGDFHRWTSSDGFAPGSGWHHVAVTYRFGEPDSIRGFIDGREVKGKWDLGGKTTRGPVGADGEIWIGSAMGGSRSASLRGRVDEVAVHRRALGAEELGTRYRFEPQPPRPDFSKAEAGEVLVEVFDGAGGGNGWPMVTRHASESFSARAFALYGLPQRYGGRGERLARDASLIRLAAKVDLPAGEHRFLIRAPGMTRLWADGEIVATTKAARVQRGAHNDMRPPLEGPLLYPRARLGTRDTEITVETDGGPVELVLEAKAGLSGRRFEVGELLVARSSGEQWGFLKPVSGEEFKFEPEAVEIFRQVQQSRFANLERERRKGAARGEAAYWAQRHQQAREFVASLESVAVPELPEGAEARNAIDHFLAAKIDQATRPAAAVGGSAHFTGKVQPLLEEHCMRCHGDKAKGGLRLDSREAALKAGDSGFAAVVPGDPEESELVYRLMTDDDGEKMPPKGDGLSDAEVTVFREWISAGAPWGEATVTVQIPETLDDLAFLRRVYLDTLGVLPNPGEIEAYVADDSSNRRERLIERLLADLRHADHWVSYWQDVLAENPRIVKPMLNNTGPFRWWIYESLLDRKPFDQMVTELIRFDGDRYAGGAGGFELATQNDVPMAAKAHVIASGFLGVEMKCARCHDAPFHSPTQRDLFSLAAMLEGKSLKIPETSRVPDAFFDAIKGRKSLIEVTHDPSRPVAPSLPFEDLMAPIPEGATGPAAIAAALTGPENERFAQVTVNRLWHRYFGEGLVEPVDDWEGQTASHPELLTYLGREFIASGYDLRHLSRLILNSAAYGRGARVNPEANPAHRFFEAPLRRRMTAEQLVDSLFEATGVPWFAEELTFDPEGWMHASAFLNFGRPQRAWQFVSLSTERDRPSLVLPRAASVVSVLEMYGWRANRSEPRSNRTAEPNVLQPALLANGTLGLWWTRASDYSDVTGVALEAESAEALVDALYLRFLTREPTAEERSVMAGVLRPGFETRVRYPDEGWEKAAFVPPVREVSWVNHFDPRANEHVDAAGRRFASGPEPTAALESDWRERLEDVVWALVNAPEMQYLP